MDHSLATTLSRRQLLTIGSTTLVAGLVAGRLPRAVAAQTSSNSLGYPEMVVTIDDQAIHAPTQIPAGFRFVTVKNTQGSGPEHMLWGRFPDEGTKQAVLNLMATPPPATPPANDPVDAYLDKMRIVGGPDYAMPGKDASGIVSFSEGSYILLSVFGNQPPALFDVTASGQAEKSEAPKADFVVQLGNMVFVGLDRGAPAGKHLWQVKNIDTLPHEMVLLEIDPKWTKESDVIAALKSPNADELFGHVKGANSILSGGQMAWQEFDLPAGHYAALCFVPMNWSGPPHALMGMIKIFDAA